MKLLNFWVTFFGVLFLVSLAVAGFLLFKVVTYVHKSEQAITNLQQKTSQNLDVQKQVCDNASIRALAGSYCK